MFDNSGRARTCEQIEKFFVSRTKMIPSTKSNNFAQQEKLHEKKNIVNNQTVSVADPGIPQKWSAIPRGANLLFGSL